MKTKQLPFKILSWIWNHKKISVGILFLLILIFILWPKPQSHIATQKVTHQKIVESLSVSGEVAGKNTVNLTFPISGKVVYVGAKKGDTVTKYQTIAALDQRTIEDNLQNAVKTAQNQQISFDVVNDFNGNRDLTDTGLSVSARRQLQTAMNTLDQTKIAVEIQKIAREQAFLIAPIDGILTRADVETPGVTASLTTTYTIVDPTSVVMDMDVDQADIGKVKEGQSVKIVFDAYPDETITQTVKRIDFVSHNTTNGGVAFTVETPLPFEPEKYRVGMSANADIVLNEKSNVLIAPLSSIIDNKYVYVKSGNTFKKRTVTLGLQNDTDAEITSGLTNGEEIALDPTQAEKHASK